MGFFDFLRGSPNEEKITVSQLGVWIENGEKKDLERFTGDAERASKTVLKRFLELENIVSQFKEKKPELEAPGAEKIGSTMQENFVLRVPPLLKLEEPREGGFTALEEFQADALERLSQITKINRDNRYLFAIYKTASQQLRDAMLNTAGDIKALEDALQPGKERKKIWAEVRNEQKTLDEITNDYKALLQEKKRLEEEEADAPVEGREDAGSSRENHMNALAELKRTEGALATPFSTMERALRKFTGGGNTSEARLSKSLCEHPLEEVETSEKLARVLELLGKLSEKIDSLELKNPEPARQAIVFVKSQDFEALLRKREQAARAVKETYEMVRKAETLEAEAKQMHARKERREENLRKNEEQQKTVQEDFEAQKKNVEEAALKVGRKIILEGKITDAR